MADQKSDITKTTKSYNLNILHTDKTSGNQRTNFWTKLTQKVTDGTHGYGSLGGFYVNSTTKIKAFIKSQEGGVSANISEYIGGKFFKIIAPSNSSRVELMVPDTDFKDNNYTPQGDGSNIYIRSEFVKGYQNNLFEFLDNHEEIKKFAPANIFRKFGQGGAKGRPFIMVQNYFKKAFNKLDIQDFEKIAPMSLLIGDFDIHSGNVGVVAENKTVKLTRFDYGGAFKALSTEVHPNSVSRHLPLQGPTNHFLDYPLSLKLTPKFAQGIFDTVNRVNENLDQLSKENFSELQKYYSKDAIISWAKVAMPSKFKDKKSDDVKIDEIENSFKSLMKKRTSSLKDYGIEIALSCVLEKTKEGFKIKDKIKTSENEEMSGEGYLRKIVKENPQYFQDVFDNNKKIKFRDYRLRSYLGKATGEKYILNNIQRILTLEDSKMADIIYSNSELTKKIARSGMKLSKDNDSETLRAPQRKVKVLFPQTRSGF